MTSTEIQAMITKIDAAITHILAGGQEYEITTAMGGGSKRIFRGADLAELNRMRKEYELMLSSLNGSRAVKIRAGW
jgi:hypothetical protein